MELREYLFHHRLKVSEFAKRIGYERGYVNKVVTGKVMPGRKLTEAIEKETQGKVTPIDLMKSYEMRQQELEL